MTLKSGEERLKEMEAEMALFEQEVLGGPVPVSGTPPVMEAVPVALSVSAVPVVRPIIGTNTYRQVQQTLEARAATFVGPPPPAFVGPACTSHNKRASLHHIRVQVTPSLKGGWWLFAVPPVRPPMMRPAFVPHILQRPGGQRLQVMRGPPIAPPLPRPPPPPPMMLPPTLQGQTPQGPSQPIQHMAAVPQVGEMVAMVSAPNSRQGPPPPIKPTPSIIQAAPTVYSAPPVPPGHKRNDVRAQRQARMEELAARVAEQQAAVMAAGLLDKKESEDSSTVIGPSMPEPEPPHTEPVESATEDKKKAKVEKVKKCIRTAAGTSWEDASLLEWDADDFRIFCGDLGNEVNDDILARAFSRYPSFLKAKVLQILTAAGMKDLQNLSFLHRGCNGLLLKELLLTIQQWGNNVWVMPNLRIIIDV
ncbi:RNA-binding protein 42 isoform X2 [Dicentrarchus labrax]|uniref:RNA-binding protein 42 isoform X2 n=1 Tax=Dicentrarchus labrax TaxID=13489 RepID=UPI0021F68445|nr:RNA-binding protein 42 isoform X2 [Dicentrarchus labrax]